VGVRADRFGGPPVAVGQREAPDQDRRHPTDSRNVSVRRSSRAVAAGS
jgi:hypothetical protein